MNDGILRINDLCWGYRQSRILEIGCSIGLFGALEGGKAKIDEICIACGTKPLHTEKLLIACCGLGLVQRDGKFFSNTEISNKYLAPSSKYYQGDIILHSMNVRQNFDEFAENIYAEPKEKETEAQSWEHFIRGMDNIASAGRAEVFLSSVELAGKKKMLDVGGGPGSYCIAACQKYPELEAVVWDLPATVAIAKEYIAKAGLEKRISTQEGDWNVDDFGREYDAVIMSNILHGPMWACQEKLSKALNALRPGGMLAVQEFLLNDQKDGPLIPALFNVMVGAYSKAELLTVIEEAGFINIKVAGESEDIGSYWVTAIKK
jgi:SAM-dependent methyltransferase